jgi:hypothetical protein
MTKESSPNQAQMQPVPPERPDLGIESVQPGENVVISESQMPWLHDDYEIPTVAVTLEGGQTVQYGSVVGGNSTLRKLASHVPADKSLSAEAGLFKALPTWLSGDHPNIDTVPSNTGEGNLYKVAKNGKDVARLMFAKIVKDDTVTIVKVGISSHKDQQRMLGVVSGSSNKRRKHDG